MQGEWTTFRLGDVSEKIGSGATPRGGNAVYLDAGRFALIRSQNIYNDGFHADGLAYIRERHAEQLKGVEVLAGDVLLNITGDSVARACQVDDRVLPARVNQHVAIVRPRPSVLDAAFLRYWMITPETQALLLSLAGGGGTRNALTKRMIESLEVRAPAKIHEQRAITHILTTLDNKIELNRRMSETLDAMARALFKSWFVDFDPVRAKVKGLDPGLPLEISELFPNRFVNSELGEIPEGWRVAALPELLDINPQRRLRKGDVAPYLDMANMPTRGHTPDALVERPYGSGMRFVNGDTLVARITPCLENGKTAYVDFLPDHQVGWGSTEYVVLRPRSPLPLHYAYCLARSDEFRDFAIQSMTGSSGRQRVPVESLAHYRITQAPQEIAGLFGAFVEPWFDRASACAAESRTLVSLRDALLPKLVSGELPVDSVDACKERSNA